MEIVDIIDDELFQCSKCESISDCKRFLIDSDIGIYHINICRINAHFDEFLVYFNEIKDRIQVLVLTETWHSQIDITNFNIDGYSRIQSAHFINSSTGIVVFIKNNLSYAFSEIIMNTAIALKIHIDLDKNAKMDLLCVYRTPSFNSRLFIQEFRKTLLENFFSDTSQNYRVVIGDMNINILPDSFDISYNEYLDLMSEFGLISLINDVTRETGNCKSCIDHCFYDGPTPLNSDNLNSCILKTNITDHYSILMTLKLNVQKVINRDDDTKIIKKINLEKFINLMKSQTWESVYLEKNIDLKAELLTNIIIMHKNTATSQKKFKQKNTPLKPWITHGLLNSIKKRDDLAKKVKKHPLNERMKLYYKKYRNKLSTILHKSKNNYFKSIIRDIPSDQPRKLWEAINEVIGICKNKSQINKINIDNTLINCSENAKLCANHFNTYFVNVGKNIKNTIFNRSNNNTTNISVINNDYFESFAKASEIEILKYIRNLRNSSSPGYDGINAVLINSVAEYIIKPLTHVFNKIFETGIIPKIYKQAIVTPIYKAGTKTDITNYRPISVICNFSKILEKCIKHRINNFLEEKKLLNDRQYGFRDNVGTNDALLDFTSLIYRSLNYHKRVLTVFLDIKKAFDSVDHDLLIKELEYIGFRGKSLLLLKNYFSDRYQKVKMYNILSTPQKIDCSVPQGTVIGPILFNIYLRRLCQNTSGEVITYADDTAITYIGDTWDEVHDMATLDLQNIFHWFSSMSLALNMSKTNYMTFSFNESGQPIRTKILIHTCDANEDNECTCRELKQVSQTRYLGVIIDYKLRWNLHIDRVNKKIRFMILTFYKLRYVLNSNILKTVYFALVQSVLQYAIVVWGGIFKTTITSLTRSQNILLRVMMHKESRYSTKRLYDESKVMTLRQLYIYNVALFSVKYSSLWDPAEREYNFRTQSAVKEFWTDRTNIQRHFIFLGPIIYNMLSVDIQLGRMPPSVLKKAIKNSIMSNEFSSIDKYLD